MNWYLKVLNQYADFSGRARRKEFWMFTLFNVIFAVVASMLDNLIGISFTLPSGMSLGYGWIYSIYLLFVIIPAIAVTVRRLHDIGKSGWNYFIAFIPVVGAIILLIWLCKDGEIGNNKWGQDPKQ